MNAQPKLVLFVALASQCAAPKSWYIHEGRLAVTTDVLTGFTESGQIAALQGAGRIWLDIGINSASTAHPATATLGSGGFGALEDSRRAGVTAFYLGFEALLDKWALNIARGAGRFQGVPIGTVQLYTSKKPARPVNRSYAMMVPIAVADNDDEMATFNVAKQDGCSSLNRLTSAEALQTRNSGWSAQMHIDCGKMIEKRSVPTISLATVLHTWLGGQQVEFLKVDVQGAELGVLRSGGARLRQVERMQLEVSTHHCVALTEGEKVCHVLFSTARELGFVPEAVVNPSDIRGRFQRGFTCKQLQAVTAGRTWDGNKLCEVDVMFARDDILGSWQRFSIKRP